MLALSIFFSLAFVSSVFSLTCMEIEKNHGLPCASIPACSVGKTTVLIDKLSTGLGKSKSTASVNLCYDSTALNVEANSMDQLYYPGDVYQACNDAVYLLDVVELFIGSCNNPAACNSNGDTYCYSEIDTSPYNKIFESGIYAPNMNHTGVMNYLIDCDKSNVAHSTSSKGSKWTWTVSVPWDVIYNPQGCPKTSSVVTTSATAGALFRANLYRVNELTPTSKCSSSSCEYVSWTPTYSNPPAFHEPTKFGYFLLV